MFYFDPWVFQGMTLSLYQALTCFMVALTVKKLRRARAWFVLLVAIMVIVSLMLFMEVKKFLELQTPQAEPFLLGAGVGSGMVLLLAGISAIVNLLVWFQSKGARK